MDFIVTFNIYSLKHRLLFVSRILLIGHFVYKWNNLTLEMINYMLLRGLIHILFE